MNTNSMLYRFVILTTIVTGMVMSGCVAPGEFEDADQDCEEGTFDVTTRDSHCSGSFELETLPLHGPDIADATDDDSIIYMEDGKLFSLKPSVDGSSLRLRSFYLDKDYNVLDGTLLGIADDESERVDNYREREFEMPAEVEGEVTSFTVLGLYEELLDLNNITLAVVHNKRELTFIDPGFADPNDSWDDTQGRTNGIFYYATPSDAIHNEPEAFTAGCKKAEGGEELEFTDIKSFQPEGKAEGRRYMFAAAKCGVLVIGKGRSYGTRPQVLAELPLDAVDLELDTENKRMLVASGLAGLKIRQYGSVIREANEVYDAIWPNDDPVATGGRAGGAGNSDGASAPEANFANNGGGNNAADEDIQADPVSDDAPPEPPEPVFDRNEGFQANEPGLDVNFNVTRVGNFRDRVIYVNSPTGEDARSRKTILFSGRVTPASTLDEQTSLVIGEDDRLFDRVKWDIVELGESHFAVMRNALNDLEEDRVDRTSSITIYDAPDGGELTIATEIPVDDTVLRVFRGDDGKLWVVHPDRVDKYTITISGDAL